jgi:hypothetical protein
LRIALRCQGVPPGVSFTIRVQAAYDLVEQARPFCWRKLQHLLRKKFYWDGHDAFSGFKAVACHNERSGGAKGCDSK